MNYQLVVSPKKLKKPTTVLLRCSFGIEEPAKGASIFDKIGYILYNKDIIYNL
jgi:hypothetical protein